MAPRGGGWKETGDFDPLSLSNTSPDPLGDPLRRGILAAAVDRDIGSCIPVLSLLPSSEFYLAICVRAGIVRVSVGLLGWYLSFFIIGGIGRSCLRLRGLFAFSFVGFALTAIGSFLLVGNGM